MKVLTVFAHPASKSFCHVVLDRFDAGLVDAGHTNEIVDSMRLASIPSCAHANPECSRKRFRIGSAKPRLRGLYLEALAATEPRAIRFRRGWSRASARK